MAREALHPPPASPRYPPKAAKAVENLLTREASSPPALRQAVHAQAVQLAEHRPANPADDVLPDGLAAYLDQVLFHADRMTDEDMARLQAQGYPEEQIYELTLCAALGAGLARLNRGLAALEAVAVVEGVE